MRNDTCKKLVGSDVGSATSLLEKERIKSSCWTSVIEKQIKDIFTAGCFFFFSGIIVVCDGIKARFAKVGCNNCRVIIEVQRELIFTGRNKYSLISPPNVVGNSALTPTCSSSQDQLLELIYGLGKRKKIKKCWQRNVFPWQQHLSAGAGEEAQACWLMIHPEKQAVVLKSKYLVF